MGSRGRVLRWFLLSEGGGIADPDALSPWPVAPPRRIVDDILELFRLSSQRLQIDESLVDIHAYFTTMCDLVQVITDKSQRRLERVQDPSLPR